MSEVADSGGNQRIDLVGPPPAPIVSRPLKTGAEFTLVLPQPRFVQKVWDKALYEPGDEAQLFLKGKHLGDKPYELIVEVADENGSWSEVDRVKADVTGGTEAKATFKFPAAKKLTAGKFIKAEWAKLEALPGDKLAMHVEAQGLEGEWIAYIVEREDPNTGAWDPVGRWDDHIKDGKADTSFDVPELEHDGERDKVGTLSDVKWLDDEIKVGEMAWLVAHAQQMEGDSFSFTLERELGPGKWEAVGYALSSVKSGEARAGILVPKRAKKDLKAVLTAVYNGEVKPGAEVELCATTVGLEGQQVTFVLEREENGRWVEEASAIATVADESAKVKVPVAELPHVKLPEDVKEQLISAKFSGNLAIGEKVTLDVVTKGMDGQTLTIILETAEGGEWVPVQETTAHVKSDGASADFVLPAPVRLLDQLVQIGFSKSRYADAEGLELVVDSFGLDGQLADLAIEEELPGGGWVEIARDRALLKQGQVKVKLVPPPFAGTGGASGTGGSAVEDKKKPGGRA